MVRFPLSVLLFVVASALHRGGASCAGTTTTTSAGRATTGVVALAPLPTAPLLADAPTDLAGGAIRAKLPLGDASAPETTSAPSEGVLIASTHVVQREHGALRIVSVDTGESAAADFGERATDNERAMRCLQENAALTPSIDAAVAGGIDVLGFTSTTTCPGHDAPDARLWVRTSDRSVYTITLTCTEEGCLPDRSMLLATFVASIAPGEPAAAPSGRRRFGPTDELLVSVDVPSGYFVRATTAEDTRTYEVFRRQRMGTPWDSASFTFMFSPSPNSLRDDYGRIDATMRTVRGTVAGRKMRFLEIRYGQRTERFARMTLTGADLDVGIVGASPRALGELRTIVARARLPRAR